jgi:hypothetical protein
MTVAFAALALSTSVVMADSALPLRDVVRFGAYAPGLPYDDTAFRVLETETLGHALELASGFVDWNYVLGESRDLALADGGRRALLYSWEPHCDQTSGCISFRDIARGRTDAYLTRVAASMKAYPYDIYVRPWAEMNAHWSPYQPTSGRRRAGTIAEFRAAWRYLFDFFRQRGVENLKFVFAPDVSTDDANVPVDQLWPGKDPLDGHGYVDVLGIDGYNWGDSGVAGSSTWQEFDELFRDAYDALTKLDAQAPVWICEFGSKEPKKNDGTKQSPAPPDPAHDKGAWFEHMFSSTAFPRLRALAYYASYLPGHDNQRDFRFESSPGSLAAVRAYLRSHGTKRRSKTLED